MKEGASLSHSFILDFGRLSFPLPPPWTGNAGRSCTSATSVCHLWKCSRCLPGGLPQRQHPDGDAALHAHHGAGKLVLAGKSKKAHAWTGGLRVQCDNSLCFCSLALDRFCAVSSSWSWVGPKGSYQYDVRHDVLLVAPRRRLACCEHAL